MGFGQLGIAEGHRSDRGLEQGKPRCRRAAGRGCKIIVFNPLKEKGLREFVDPQDPLQMTVGKATKIDHMYCQVRPGGDIAALMGVCKRVIEADRAALDVGAARVLDTDFIE